MGQRRDAKPTERRRNYLKYYTVNAFDASAMHLISPWLFNTHTYTKKNTHVYMLSSWNVNDTPSFYL